MKENAFANVFCKIVAILFRPKCVNPQRASELIRFNIVNIMVADTLAPCVARSPAAMIFTMQNK